jgi:hypothetical protein
MTLKAFAGWLIAAATALAQQVFTNAKSTSGGVRGSFVPLQLR